jgi:hypothetical protein
MKKTTKLTKKSLLLSTEHIRQLTDTTLKAVVGGDACDPTNHPTRPPDPTVNCRSVGC